MLLEELPQRTGAEALLVGDHLDEARQVGHQVALVPVRKHGGHRGVVELDVLVVYLDEADRRVRPHKGQHRRLDSRRDLALNRSATE